MSLKFFGIAMAFLFLIGIALAGDLAVTTVSYDPVPALPDGSFNLWAIVKNNSTSSAENVSVKLNFNSENFGTGFPFSLPADELQSKPLGNLQSQDSAQVKFKVLVAKNTADGKYTIGLELSEKGNATKIVNTEIQVLNRRPKIRIESASPTIAEIGKTIQLDLIARNTGSSDAFDVAVGVSEDRTVTSTGVVVERDIVPLGAVFSSIAELKQGEAKTISIPLQVNPSAQAKAYFIPIKIEFFDANKTKYSDTDYIGLKVSDETEIGALFSEAKPLLVPGKKSKISIDLYNFGLGSAKFLTAKIQSKELSFTQSDFFIGTLESDDSDSISTDAIVGNSVKPGNYSIDLELSYKNGFGEEKIVKKSVPFAVFTEAEAAVQNPQQSGNGSIVPIVAILAIAVVGFVWFRNKAKKK